MGDPTEADRLRRRYEHASDEELTELARSGQDSFTRQAWELLTAEMSRRRIEVPDDDPLAGARSGGPARVPLDGWLLGFTLWTVLGLLVSAPIVGGALRRAVVEGGLPAWSSFSLGIATLLAGAIGLRLIVKRHPTTRLYWVWLSSAMAFAVALPSLLAVWSGTQVQLRPLVSSAVSLAWAIYWYRSDRVRRTFDRTEGQVRDVAPNAPEQPMTA